jgi:hypothetical protein
MRHWIIRTLSLICLLALALSGFTAAVTAQEGSQRYDNRALGVAFDLPAGWEVVVDGSRLIAAAPADLAAVQAGDPPQGLTLRMVLGTFNELGIADATEIPGLLTRLVASNVNTPSPENITWGNGSGYTMQVALPDGLTTRVALLAVAGGRVAVVRGLAPSAVWDGGAGVQFDTIAQSLAFSLPERDEEIIQTVDSNDGGVLWHYQAPPPGDWRVVTAGGITFDMFDVMYMAAGPGGVLAINMTTGEEISYMGPWYGGNFVDIAIGPDTKLYLANIADDTENAVMVVDRAGNWARGWGTRGDGEGQFAPGMPQTIAVTPGGEVWTVSEGHGDGIRNRLYKFDTFGNLQQTVDLDTINPDLSGIHLDANPRTGTLYLVGATGNLNVADSNGQALVKNLAAEILQGLTPRDIGIGPDDNLIVALDTPGLDGFGFLELSVSGRLLDVFGLPYDTARGGAYYAGEYLHPAGLVIGPDGTGYFTETTPQGGYTQVQRFTFSGDGLLPLGVEAKPGKIAAPDAESAQLAADPARGGGTISYGQTVTGSLNNRYPLHKWTFDGRNGEHIIITMIDPTGAGLIDPMIVLRDAEGRQIAVNDDVGTSPPEGLGPRDSLLDFYLPGNGLYTIEATRFGGRGDYVLTLELVAQ